jgi:PDZ domain/Aspartyl protease
MRQKGRFTTGFLACLLIAMVAFPSSARPQRASAKVTNPRLGLKVPFTFFRGALLFVQARINDSAPMWLMVDTASNFSFLDTAQAASLGIKSIGGGATITGGGGGAIELTYARGLSLEVAGLKLANQTFALTNWKNRYDRNVVGMLGAPFLEQFTVEIDYDAQQLTLRDPQPYRYSGKGAVLPLDFSDGLPTARLGFTVGASDPFEVKLHIDTGASQTLILNPNCVETHNLLASTQGMKKVQAGSMSGGVTYYMSRAQSVQLGRFNLSEMIANYAPKGGFKVNPGTDGVLGNGVLKRFKVVMDYARKRMILEPSDLYAVPFDYEMTGLILGASGKEIGVKEVIKASAAGDAGLQAGDALLAVNDRATSALSLTEVRRMFKQDGSVYTLTIRRGTETQQLKLRSVSLK